MKGIFISILLLVLVMNSIQAQELVEAKQRFFKTGASLFSETFRDEAVSQISFNGSGVQLQLGREVQKERLIRGWDIALRYGRMASNASRKLETTPSGTHLAVNLQYRYLTQIRVGKIAVFAGGVLSNNINLKVIQQDNNAISHNNSLLGINPAINFQYAFSNKKQRSYQVNWQLQTLIFSYNSRPSYIGISQFDANQLESLFDGKLVSIDKVSSTRSDLSIDRILKNGNRIRLMYTWQYDSNTQGGNLLQSGLHILGVSSLFKF